MIAWFAHNRIVANLLMVTIVASGFLALGTLKREVVPEFGLGLVQVSMAFRGATPKEVEEAVCIRIEEAVASVDGIKTLTSTATAGQCQVRVEVRSGFESRSVLEDLKAAVDAIDTFPADAGPPVLTDIYAVSPVISAVIAGDADLATLKRIGTRVREGLLALPEISRAELVNVPSSEISVEVPESSLRRFGLTFGQIAAAVRGFSIDTPGGSVKTGKGEVLLRTEGRAQTQEELERLPLASRPDGTRILLRDVASVVDGFEDTRVYAMFDGQPSVTIHVYRVGEENATDVAQAVRKYIADIQPSLAGSVALSTWLDQARVLEDRIAILTENALSGLAVVFVVLAVFLRIRLAFWVTLGIPISFLGAIATMQLLGVSISMLSLFSFILVLGIVVDDAIVVGENIHKTQRRTGKRTSAAIRGTWQVLLPVVFGVLTTMVAFVPMLFVPGVLGSITSVFPLVILPCLFFSLVESNLILPCHLSHYRDPSPARERGAVSRAWNGFFLAFERGLDGIIRNAYRPLLERAMEWRYLTMAVALFCVLVTVGMVGARHVRFVVFPEIEPENIVAYLAMPQGSPVEDTERGVERIADSAIELQRELEAEWGSPQIRHIASTVGEHPSRKLQTIPNTFAGRFSGEHLGEVNLGLHLAETRDVRASEVVERWRRKVGEIPGAVELSVSQEGFGSAKAIDVRFGGPDPEDLRAAMELFKSRLSGFPGVVEITDSLRGARPELKVSLTSQGEALGLTPEELGRQIRQGFFGAEAHRVQRGQDDVRVMVRYPRAERRSLADVQRMRIRTPAGDPVPFSAVAVATMGHAPTSITRVDRHRSVSVQADVDESVTTAGQVVDALRADLLPELAERFPEVSVAFEGDEADLAESLDGLARGLGLAMFAMFAMLAIPLRSYVKPAIIVGAIPFGMVGAVWGHWLLGMDLSFLSLCGMVALAGVVVNDSLVLVSFIDRRRGEFGRLRKAVRAAGEARFRAILLTSLTTAAGVSPLILETSMQANFLIPMAVSLAAGVLFATAVTLVLVPASYLVLEDIKAGARWLAGGSRHRRLDPGGPGGAGLPAAG